MLDIRAIRDQYGVVRKNLERRHDAGVLAGLDGVRADDERWRAVQKELEGLRAERNRVGQVIAQGKRERKDVAAEQRRASEVSARITQADKEVSDVKARRDAALLRVPNLLHESVPEGRGAEENAEVRRWGTPRKPTFELVPHADLAERLGLADFARAGKVAGAGFAYLMGDLVLLDLALQRYALDVLGKRGFVPVSPPLMMRRAPYEGVTDLADFESVMYKIESDDLYLIATSEHPIGAMYQDEIIESARLPLKLAGISPCFRREIGAHGVDTRGLFRMHQFYKVEQFVFCEPADSWKLHEEILANAEHIFQALELPYRVVNVCTGDIGTVAAKKYDIEAWSPRANAFREVVSCSNCTDYQARRLNIRAGKYGGDKEVLHTLNSTAVATSRAIVMLLENHQNPDGTVTIPKALRPYMDGRERLGQPRAG